MPRTKGQNGKTIRVREDLETVLGHIADHAECSPRVEDRIRQAIRRTGLHGLLDPALEDLERMVKDVDDARAQIRTAIGKLMEI